MSVLKKLKQLADVYFGIYQGGSLAVDGRIFVKKGSIILRTRKVSKKSSPKPSDP